MRTSQRQPASQASSSSSSSKGKEPFTPYHSAASRQLAVARALAAAPSSSDEDGPSPSPVGPVVHYLPPDEVLGADFEIDWENIWLNGRKLPSQLVGYRVVHKSQLKGGRTSSPIWKYGAQLEYRDNGKEIKIWLCKVCHLERSRTAAKKVSAYHHIVDHLKDTHRVAHDGSLMPDLPRAPSNPWEATANVAGAQRAFSHKPWAERALQSAWVDWVILKDLSFRDATSTATRALLTWNRVELLDALPASHETLSRYVVTTLSERKGEIEVLLSSARSKVSVSADVWSSGNHMSFMAVVAHFVGKMPG